MPRTATNPPGPVPVDRRAAFAALTGAAALFGLAWKGGSRLSRLAGFARPAAAGTSSMTCAQCGTTGHTMLAARCPAAPHVL